MSRKWQMMKETYGIKPRPMEYHMLSINIKSKFYDAKGCHKSDVRTNLTLYE
jgi:hypothetical protein